MTETTSSDSTNVSLNVEQLQRAIGSQMVENAISFNAPSGSVQSIEAQSRIANQDLIREVQFSRVFQVILFSYLQQ